MSLINDALKRAAESQSQAQAPTQTRPRGPKGIQDLPVPMLPVPPRERPTWLPVLGICVLIVALLSASGFFFSKWKERQNWQPYAETPEDPPEATPGSAPQTTPTPRVVEVAKNMVPTPATQPSNVRPGTGTMVTSPPARQLVTPEMPVPPPVKPVVEAPPVPPTKPAEPPDPPPVVPPPTPPVVARVDPPPRIIIPPVNPPPSEPATKGNGNAANLSAVEFPEMKLQGISRRKNKTFAVVNGKTLTIGDRVEGVMLIKISDDSVIVEKGGARRELFLLR